MTREPYDTTRFSTLETGVPQIQNDPFCLSVCVFNFIVNHTVHYATLEKRSPPDRTRIHPVTPS